MWGAFPGAEAAKEEAEEGGEIGVLGGREGGGGGCGVGGADGKGAAGEGASGAGEADAGGAAVGGVGEALDPAGLFEAVEAVGHGRGTEQGGRKEFIDVEPGFGRSQQDDGEDVQLPEGEAEGRQGFIGALFEVVSETANPAGDAEGGGCKPRDLSLPLHQHAV
jgi:hypothetical protein